MRAYHHFSINRTKRHILVSFAFLLFPIVLLSTFSAITHISIFETFSDLLISTIRLFTATILALIIAWVLVVVFVRGKTEGTALALFDVMQSLPTFTILPIAVHYFGTGEMTIIAFLTITVVWPVIFSIVSALKQADRSWKEAVTISRISGFDYIRYYLLPVTAPGIITGTIIGLGDGWEALIATELLLHLKTGLGPFFDSFSNNTTQTMFGVLVFLSVVFTINKFILLPLLEKSHRLIEQ